MNLEPVDVLGQADSILGSMGGIWAIIMLGAMIGLVSRIIGVMKRATGDSSTPPETPVETPLRTAPKPTPQPQRRDTTGVTKPGTDTATQSQPAPVKTEPAWHIRFYRWLAHQFRPRHCAYCGSYLGRSPFQQHGVCPRCGGPRA